jgi:hypothetical protein
VKSFLNAAVLLIGLWSHALAQTTNRTLWSAEHVHYTLVTNPYWAWIISPAEEGDNTGGSFEKTVEGIFRSERTPLIQHVWLGDVHRGTAMQKEVMDRLKDTVVLRRYPTRHGSDGRMYIDGTTNPLSVEMCRLVEAAILETSLVREMDEALLPRGLHIGSVSTEKLCIFFEKDAYHWDGIIHLMIERARQNSPAHGSPPSRFATNRTAAAAGSRR